MSFSHKTILVAVWMVVHRKGINKQNAKNKKSNSPMEDRFCKKQSYRSRQLAYTKIHEKIILITKKHTSMKYQFDIKLS